MGGLRTGWPGASLDPHPVTATAAALSLSPVAVNQHLVIAAHVLPQPGTLRVLPQKGAAEMAGSAEGAGFPSTFQLVWKLPRDGGLRMGGSANDCLRSFVGADGSGRSHTTASGSSTHATQRRKSVRRRPAAFRRELAHRCHLKSPLVGTRPGRRSGVRLRHIAAIGFTPGCRHPRPPKRQTEPFTTMIDREAQAGRPGLEAASFPSGFHENDELRSQFMRRLILRDTAPGQEISTAACTIPKVPVRFWHNAREVPDDVQECLSSWGVLETEGFKVLTYDDASAESYISDGYGREYAVAFSRCHHPAMRSDFFRLCYMLASGGFYVDADDVLTEGYWQLLYGDDRLKLNPLCYDVPSGGMVDGADLWEPNARKEGRIYYVNNNPLVAAPGHPVLQRALERATAALLNTTAPLDIQSTTGPGNLTAVLAEHAHALALAGEVPDFAFLRS